MILKYTVYDNTCLKIKEDKYIYLYTVTQRYCILESWPPRDLKYNKYFFLKRRSKQQKNNIYIPIRRILGEEKGFDWK